MNIYEIEDADSVVHWVFAESIGNAYELCVELLANIEGLPIPGILKIRELTLFEAVEVHVRTGYGTETLCGEFEADPSQRYVACSEWPRVFFNRQEGEP